MNFKSVIIKSDLFLVKIERLEEEEIIIHS
jgi:hypothetical protein